MAVLVEGWQDVGNIAVKPDTCTVPHPLQTATLHDATRITPINLELPMVLRYSAPLGRVASSVLLKYYVQGQNPSK
jgi:hypothetical protein